jgi:hypothetical protein
MSDEQANAGTERENSSVEGAGSGRPEGIPEKFWDVDNATINSDRLLQSYKELESYNGKRMEDLRASVAEEYVQTRMADRPASVDDYEVRGDGPVADALDGVDGDDPLLGWWRETAFEAGLSQAQFESGLSAYITRRMADQPNPVEEMAELGENGRVRVDAVEVWSRQNLPAELFPIVAGMCGTANGVKVMEQLINRTTPVNMAAVTGSIAEQAPTKGDIRDMMNDPRYWDPNERDKYVKEVERLVSRVR